MRAKEIIMEGGWADTRTQSASPITPAVVEKAVIVIQNFIKKFNKFVKTKGLPAVGGGLPVGSSYYYQKDLVDDPTKEYGDIDIQFLLPRFPNKSDAQVQESYVELVKAYTKVDSNISTNGGKNVIFNIDGEYRQVDLVMSYYDNEEWMGALVPERGIKGVIGASVYSSLAEYLNLSISSFGVQAKTRDGKPVSFRQSKDVILQMVSKDPRGWGIDVAKFIAKAAGINNPKISNDLKQNSGVNPDNIKIADWVATTKGIAHTLELNGIDSYSNIITGVTKIYADKITKAANSSKFLKAETPKAMAQAQETKDKLQKGLKMVLSLFK